jgi:hypothetical protein
MKKRPLALLTHEYVPTQLIDLAIFIFDPCADVLNFTDLHRNKHARQLVHLAGDVDSIKGPRVTVASLSRCRQWMTEIETFFGYICQLMTSKFPP